MDMQSAYGMVEKTNHISIICGLVAGAVLLLICLYTYYVYQKSKVEAVSYTHLDVYKRQILSLSHRRLEKQRTVRQYGVAEFADMNM